MKIRPFPFSQEYLRSVLMYDAISGVFTWKDRHHDVSRWPARRWNDKNAGKRAGRQKSNGYTIIYIDSVPHHAHRLAWFYKHGEPGNSEIDHIDGDPGNNAITNLRLATHSQNMANMKHRRTNPVGLKGVCRTSGGKPWKALIRRRGKSVHLGVFDTPEQAHAAYCAAARQEFGEFATAKEN